MPARAQRLARKLLRALKPRRPHPAILMYHRVVSLRRDPWDLAVEPTLFEAQMAYLRAQRTPMAMDELVKQLGTDSLPANAVAVTFDDGYLDNLVNAKPTLAKYEVPATVFISTGFIGSNTPFWWDELAGMILQSSVRVKLKLSVRGKIITLAWGQQERADSDETWKGWDKPRSARQRSLVAVWHELQSATEAERADAFRVLRKSLKAPEDSLGLPMTAAQLKELAAGSLISVGGHTITHRSLTDLDRSTSRFEIRQGGEQCRALTGLAVNGFAYPYGNFDAEVRRDVAQSNFSWACTTERRSLDDGKPDVFELPRIAVSNLSMQVFIRSMTI